MERRKRGSERKRERGRRLYTRAQRVTNIDRQIER